MSRSLVPLALLLLGALGLAAWFTRGGRNLQVDRGAGPGVIQVGPGGDPVLAEGSSHATGAPEVAAEAPATASRLPASPRMPGQENDPMPVPDVAGVLTTFEGRPVSDALVRLTWEEEEEESELMFFGPETFARDVRTDARGTFLFEGVSRTVKGRFLYGADLLLGSPISHPADPEADWQILRLPEFDPQDALARIEVVTAEGRPLEIQAVELEFRGPAPSILACRPTADDRVVEPGRVTLHALVPGKWSVWIAADGGGDGSLEFEIRERDEVAGLTIVLPWFEGSQDTTISAAGDPEERLWVDPSTGIHDWLPEDTLALGEVDSDRHFAHTLRLGHGPVSAATLTIRMRSINVMSTNDAIYLEYVGQREYRWRSGIQDLLPGQWRNGDRATLRLNLSVLPTPDSSVNLLPYLEDGLLDVVVQDDTAIDSVSLRVVR